MTNIPSGLIFQAIVGSQSYGTNLPTSDIDHKGVYMNSIPELVSFGYNPQVDVTKDETYWEVRRFLELLQSANPTVLELLYSPSDCVLLTTPQFELIKENRDNFLTKKCLLSFGGFAVAQIKKARGLDKKMNWEKGRVERKTPIDFCYAVVEGKTIPLKVYLKDNNLKQELCGLVKLNHFGGGFALYYDYSVDYGADTSTEAYYKPLGFHGIILDDSNSIRTSSVPEYIKPLTILYFNQGGYSSHCKDYREYQEWIACRNVTRYVDTVQHNHKIDGKNLLHCRRLLDMATEIATEGTLNVRRPNADYLLSIRRGEVKLEDIIDKAEEDLKALDLLFANSNLPDDCDKTFVNDLLLQIRFLD